MNNARADFNNNSISDANNWKRWVSDQLFRGAPTAKKVAIIFGVGIAVGLIEVHSHVFVLQPLWTNIFTAQNFSQFKDKCLLDVRNVIFVYKCLSLIIKNSAYPALVRILWNRITLIGLSALGEELIFRFGSMNVLKSMSDFLYKKVLGIECRVLVAVFISALMFGYCHEKGDSQFLATMSGVTYGFLFESYGLICCTVAHTVHNVVVYSLVLTAEVAKEILKSSKPIA